MVSAALTTRDALILEHQWVAITLATKTARAWRLPVDDMRQEAFTALVIAADHFDGSRKTKFSTYAFVIIKNRLHTVVLSERKHSHPVGVTEIKPDSVGRARTHFAPQVASRLDDIIPAHRDMALVDLLESHNPSPEEIHMQAELLDCARLALRSAARIRCVGGPALAADVASNLTSREPKTLAQIAKRHHTNHQSVQRVMVRILEVAASMM